MPLGRRARKALPDQSALLDLLAPRGTREIKAIAGYKVLKEIALSVPRANLALAD